MHWIRVFSLFGAAPLLEAARREEVFARVAADVDTDGSLHSTLAGGSWDDTEFGGEADDETDHDAEFEGETEASLAELALRIGAENASALVQSAASGSLTQEDLERLELQMENVPMWICNSICAKCANGDVIYIRRSLTWAWFLFRVLIEPYIVRLWHLTGGRILAERLQQKVKKLSSWRIPNECRSIAVFRQSTRVDGNGTMVVKLTHQDYTEYPLLKILMKNMETLARREKDAGNGGKVSAKNWFRRVTPLKEKLYKEQGMVPVVVEDVVSAHFCGEEGLLREEHPHEEPEEEFDDHPLGWNSDEVLSALRSHKKTSNFHEHNPFVIQQESNWDAFRRAPTKGSQRSAEKAMAQCHAVADSFQTWAHADERKLAQQEARRQANRRHRRASDALNPSDEAPEIS